MGDGEYGPSTPTGVMTETLHEDWTMQEALSEAIAQRLRGRGRRR